MGKRIKEEDDLKEDFGEKFTTPIEENGDVVMQNLDKWVSVASCRYTIYSMLGL
jgi:hypothetical protein